jgi:uncharacterized protein YndB with AHSA1/START domain
MKNKTTIKAEPGKQELFIYREFDAPRDLVFKVFTEGKYLEQWLGPCDMKMKIEKHEAKKGGAYRYIHTNSKGMEFAFHGICHDLHAPEWIVRTFEFEGLPERGHVSMETARFEALPGDRTKLTIQSVFQSNADRDGMIQSGMERGVNESHERLDELLAKELMH